MSEAKSRRWHPGLAGQVMIGLALGVATVFSLASWRGHSDPL
ncbi:MAG: hypothetical protein OEN48_15810 [Betaproteobacteria bacterium]|nr:hypothetical protein [Betaproteobacteria bacterium]